MTALDDIRIAKEMGITHEAFYDFLSGIERLNPRDLNELAMQLLTRANMKLEAEYKAKAKAAKA